MDRVYRALVPSDLPKVLAGKLKAVYKWYDYTYPATLISVRSTVAHRCDGSVWLIPADINKLSDDKHDSIEYGSHNIFVDVTKPKRYAIWNHKAQKFQSVDAFQTRQDAEIWRDKFYNENVRDNFYVVEWEIKEEV